jgi:hypothetical protein
MSSDPGDRKSTCTHDESESHFRVEKRRLAYSRIFLDPEAGSWAANLEAVAKAARAGQGALEAELGRILDGDRSQLHEQQWALIAQVFDEQGPFHAIRPCAPQAPVAASPGGEAPAVSPAAPGAAGRPPIQAGYRELAQIYHHAFRQGTDVQDHNTHMALYRIKAEALGENPSRAAIEHELSVLYNGVDQETAVRITLDDEQFNALVALMKDPREPCMEHFPHESNEPPGGGGQKTEAMRRQEIY